MDTAAVLVAVAAVDTEAGPDVEAGAASDAVAEAEADVMAPPRAGVAAVLSILCS